MNIELSSPRDIVVVKERKRTVSSITVTEMIDKPIDRKVIAMTVELGGIILWEGDAYDTIGQWTDIDVVNRINEMYNS